MTIRYSRSERQQHLDAWQQSGLSKKHYYRLHDVNIATFYYWLKHHHDEPGGIHAASKGIAWLGLAATCCQFLITFDSSSPPYRNQEKELRCEPGEGISGVSPTPRRWPRLTKKAYTSLVHAFTHNNLLECQTVTSVDLSLIKLTTCRTFQIQIDIMLAIYLC
ncbi:TPA: IS66 family insertion sequence element accessory protein TnpA [Serratia fonticola]